MTTTYNFRSSLQDKIIELLKKAVGQGTDPVYYVRNFQKYLPTGEIPLKDFPSLVVNVKQARVVQPGEIGTLKEIYEWTVHIYYLDVSTEYDDGERKRDEIYHRASLALELNPRLDSLAVQMGPNLTTEKVYDSNFTDIIWDSSGQDEYFTFVVEMYLSVDTSKT